MKLEIISPEKLFFKGDNIDLLKVPGEKGEFTVLPHHAPIISTLVKGYVKYIINNVENSLAIESGFIEIHNDEITICVEQLTI
jgi:F-type H+-transporting ATPase subunit epsilon